MKTAPFAAVIVTLLAALSAGACGFRPLYATTPTGASVIKGSDLLDQVWITTIQGQSGVILRNYLLDGFYRHGYPQTARYELTVGLSEFVRDVDVQKNDTTTRAQYVILATYTITDRTAEQVIDAGQTRGVAGYNILISQYTTLVSQNDARDRALKELADKIQTRTALVLSEPEARLAPDQLEKVRQSQSATPVMTTGNRLSLDAFDDAQTTGQSLDASSSSLTTTGTSADRAQLGTPASGAP